MYEYDFEQVENEITGILTDTLHYPELAKALESLTSFERGDLKHEIGLILDREFNRGYNQYIQDQEDAYNNGVTETVEAIKQHLEEWFDRDDCLKRDLIISIIDKAVL